jgi:DNA-3-methyladenine glycosylase II
MTHAEVGVTFVYPLATTGPFNLQATVRMLQRRPANRVDQWENDRYMRAFQTADGLRLIAVSNAGTIVAPDLRLEILGGGITSGSAQFLIETTRWMLGLDALPAPSDRLVEVEPRLSQVVRALHGFRSPAFPSLFETCARVIPFQQLSLDAGTTITGRFVNRFGAVLTLGDREWTTFPTPEVIADASIEVLRETGLSRAKSVAIQSLAERAIAGELTRERHQSRSSEDVLNDLQKLPGIGPWTAGVILLRGLRRVDVFPTGDVGAARNLPMLLGEEQSWSPADACAFAERFGDQRGYLYFLGLGSQLLARELIEDVQSARPGIGISSQ